VPVIKFRGVVLNRFLSKGQEGGTVLRIFFTADYSDTVMQHMGKMNWAPLPNFIESAKLVGSLVGCTKFGLVPNGTREDNALADLSSNSVEIACSSVGKFSLHRVKTPTGGTTVELRFVVNVNSAGAAGLLDTYRRTVGDAVSVLDVTYAEQTENKSADDDDDDDDKNQPLFGEGEEGVAQPDGSVVAFPAPKKRGRPPGSLNKPKTRTEMLNEAPPASGEVIEEEVVH
jgi:hypothetical protein